MSYNPTIGLEIHAELLTKSKVYCECENSFGGDANERVCPVCTGMPGTLPTVNKNVYTLAARAGIALGSKVNNYSAFDRKNYFYPDLPKAYQITQLNFPICSGGMMCGVGIHQIHIEEDAGKLSHTEDGSYADYNRCGVPLIEIVTEPDLKSADEVLDFVREVILRLKYADVCDARLEQGSLRVDVNISVSDTEVLGTRAEIKNLNSLRSIKRAIEFEIKRQSKILSEGGRIEQETRRFDEKTGETYTLRSKEETQDYRYFPEPDILPVFMTDAEIDDIRLAMPEMPDKRKERYINQYGLSEESAGLITADRDFSDFFDLAAKDGNYDELSKLMLGAVSKGINEGRKLTFPPEHLSLLAKMSKEGKVSKNSANEIVSMMFESADSPEEIAKRYGMLMEDNIAELNAFADKILSENPDAVSDYKNGNKKAFGFLMGQLVRLAGKSVNPKLAKDVLTGMLDGGEESGK